MKKKILIGSLLVLILLLLMPSIPAIQQKTVEHKVYSDFVEQLNTVDFKDFKGINKLDGIKHTPLYYIVYFIADFRTERANILFDISCHIDNWGQMDIYYPIIFLRVIWLDITVYKWCNFWNNISETLGWGWNLPYQ